MGQTLKRIAPQLVTLTLVVALVTVIFPNFLAVSFDGTRFVGPAVDVLKRSAPVALLGVGMTCSRRAALIFRLERSWRSRAR